jgi:hypothetical protein
LLRLSREFGDEPVTRSDRPIIRSCWSILARESADVTGLADERVMLGGDHRLYRCEELLLNDAPAIAELFDEITQQRFLKAPDGLPALRRAGLRDLRSCLRPKIVDLGAPVEAALVVDRVPDRQAQLARIVNHEGGDWRDVVNLVAQMRVDVRERVVVQWSLPDFDVPPAPAAEAALHHDGNARLTVAAPGGKPDWFEIASELRELFCPGSSRAVAGAIEDAIAVGDGGLAHRKLDRLGYPPLDKEQWKEVQAAAEAQRLRAEQDAAAEEPPEPASLDGEFHDKDAHDPSEAQVRRPQQQDTKPEEPPVEAVEAQGDGSETQRDAEPRTRPDGQERRSDDRSSPRPARGRTRHRQRSAPEPGAGARQNGGGTATGHGSRAAGAGAASSTTGRHDGGGGQFVSYLEPKPKPAERDGAQRQRDAIGEAGVNLVVADLESEYEGTGYRVRKMEDRKKGYDVRVESVGGEVIRYIEVKTKKGLWDLRGVWLSPAQFADAQQLRERFTIAVVEQVYDAEARIFYLNDPATGIARFCFDYGWSERAGNPRVVLGAVPHPDKAPSDGDDAVERLLEQARQAGLPDAESPFATAAGVELLAAWPDERVGITDEAAMVDGIDGWKIKPASAWTAAELIDAIRGGQ